MWENSVQVSANWVLAILGYHISTIRYHCCYYSSRGLPRQLFEGGLYSRAAYIKLSMNWRNLYRLWEEPVMSGWCMWIMKLWHRAESNFKVLVSHWFAIKSYVHGTSNPLPRFLLPVTSQPMPQEMPNLAKQSWPTICSTLFTLTKKGSWSFPSRGCSHAVATKQGWCLFHSAPPEVWLLFEGGH